LMNVRFSKANRRNAIRSWHKADIDADDEHVWG
jgi:hypothetical protein